MAASEGEMYQPTTEERVDTLSEAFDRLNKKLIGLYYALVFVAVAPFLGMGIGIIVIKYFTG